MSANNTKANLVNKGPPVARKPKRKTYLSESWRALVDHINKLYRGQQFGHRLSRCLQHNFSSVLERDPLQDGVLYPPTADCPSP